MKTSHVIVFAVCLTSAALLWKWTDGYHLLYGGLLLLLLFPAVRFVRSRGRTGATAVRSKEPPLTANVARALGFSVVVVGALWAGFEALALVGAPNPFEDAGRVEFSIQLSGIEQRKAFREAISLIDQKLTDVASEDWRRELEFRLYLNLISAGRHDTNESAALFGRAAKVAAMEHQRLLAELLLDGAQRRSQLRAEEKEHRAAGQWRELADLLQAVCALRLEHEWDGDARQELYESLVELGRAADTLDEAQSAFAKAEHVAKTYNLDDREAATLKEDVLRLRSFQRQGMLQELIVLLRQRMEKFPAPQSAGFLYDMLLRHAALQTDLKARLPLYREAAALAEKHGVPSDEAAKQLAFVLARVGDLESFAAQIQVLQSGQKHVELIQLLQQRMDSRPPGQWDLPLAQWQLDAYCRQADRSDVSTRIDLCRRAQKLAMQYRLDSSDADSRLAAAEKELKRRDDFLAKLTELRQQGRFTELLSVLKIHSESPKEEWLLPVGEAIFAAWLEWGDSAKELNDKAWRYEQAVATAAQHSLDGAPAETKRDLVKSELDRLARLVAERNRPRNLLVGTQAKLLRVSLESYPPSVIAHVEVNDPDGEPLDILQPRDFRVALAGTPVDSVALAPVSQNPVPASLLVCIDTSESTANSLPVAVEGMTMAIDRLAMLNVEVEIASFGAKTNTVCPWTDDKNALRKCLLTLEASGPTALNSTVSWAAAELSRRRGERVLVVFTDGRNTVGDATLEQTIAACQHANVRVHAVGLRTKDLDGKALATLAQQTNGRYVEASNVGELSQLLAETSSRVRQDYYRLVLTPKSSSPLDDNSVIEVRVGGENAVELTKRIGQRTESSK